MKKFKFEDNNFSIELKYYASGDIMMTSYNKFTRKGQHQHIPHEIVSDLIKFVEGKHDE